MVLDDLEALIATVEQLSYSEMGRSAYFSRLAEGLCRTLPFSHVQISLFHREGKVILAGGDSLLSHARPRSDQAHLKPGESKYDRRDGDTGQVHLGLDHCFVPHEILRIEAQTDAECPLANHVLQDLLGTCAVLAGNFLLRNMGRELQDRLSDQQRLAAMISQLSQAEAGSQPGSEFCRIVQTMLEVDRVSLLWVAPHSARLLFTSASATIARNTTAVRLLEQISAEVGRQGERFEIEIGGINSPVSPRLRKELDDYVEETSVRLLKWIPVCRKETSHSTPIGLLLLEHFSTDWPVERQQRILELAEPHAVHSAQRVLSASRGSFWSRLQIALADRKMWYGGWLTALALVAFCLLSIQKDLEIPVDGVLRPAHRAAVFAPMQGVVDQISVRHGMHVDQGEMLMTLRAPDLAIEERRISGEIATLRSRLESLKSARIRSRDSGSRSKNETDLSAEESDLEAQLKGFTAQLALIREQTEFLIVKAPLSGQVDRWDLNQALADRPVAHGQYLCDVLDVDGDWVVELSIPDDAAGYVLRAEAQGPCPVSYLFRTNPDRKYDSRIESISNSVQLAQDGRPVVLARMPAATEGDPQFRVGAGVLARIHCGKRSIGFVYLREVIEFFQRIFWF